MGAILFNSTYVSLNSARLLLTEDGRPPSFLLLLHFSIVVEQVTTNLVAINNPTSISQLLYERHLDPLFMVSAG